MFASGSFAAVDFETVSMKSGLRDRNNLLALSLALSPASPMSQ